MRLLIEFLLVWIAYDAGWRCAHYTVAKECERLGRFFVGDRVFHCNLIIEKEDKHGSKEN